MVPLFFLTWSFWCFCIVHWKEAHYKRKNKRWCPIISFNFCNICCWKSLKDQGVKNVNFWHCKFLNPVLYFNRRIFTFTHFFCLHLTFFVYLCNQKQHRKSTWSTSLSLCLFLLYSFAVLIQTSVSRFSIFFFYYWLIPYQYFKIEVLHYLKEVLLERDYIFKLGFKDAHFCVLGNTWDFFGGTACTNSNAFALVQGQQHRHWHNFWKYLWLCYAG